MAIVYAREAALSVDDYILVVGESSLGATRPLADRERVQAMIAGANLVVSARLDGECVGLARCVTDFSWFCYCSDLAVRGAYQKRGIGTGLLRACRDLLGDGVTIGLLATPDAVSYYERVGTELGLRRSTDAFYMPRTRGV